MNPADVAPPPGLPEHLPDGEEILWQGRPTWWPLAVHAFHVRKAAVYFGLLMAWRGGDALWQGAAPVDAMSALLGVVPFAVGAVAILAGLAWISSRTSLYTITNRRVAMRIGMALTVYLNLPFNRIDGASLRMLSGGGGDIPLVLGQGHRMGYAVLWPHARPWRLSRPEPMLRAVPDAQRVAGILTDALLATGASAASRPERVQESFVPMPQPVAA